MEKKVSNKEWGCNHGCIVDKKPCKHIEAYIAITNGSMSREFVLKLTQVNINEEPIGQQEDYEEKHKKTLLALISAGLSKRNADIIMERFVDKLSLKEIASSQGFAGKQSVQNAIGSILKGLKSNEKLKQILKELNEQ